MKKKSFITFILMMMLSNMLLSQQATIDGSVCVNIPSCPPKSVCENNTITMTAGITSGVIDSVLWRQKIYNGTSWIPTIGYTNIGKTTTISVPFFEPATVGHKYWYQLIVYIGGIGYSAFADLNVNPAPTATLLATKTTICAGELNTFSASAGGVNYDFRINGVSAQSGASSTFATTILNNGDQVTVTINNGTCTSTSAPITITVRPSVTVASATGNTVGTPVCINNMVSVTFTGLTGTPPYSFGIYNDNAGSFGTLYYTVPGTFVGPDVTIQFPQPANGPVPNHILITDNNGCTN